MWWRNGDSKRSASSTKFGMSSALAEMLLKILVVGHEANGIADQARGGFTSGGQ